jgi:hypothetical protein
LQPSYPYQATPRGKLSPTCSAGDRITPTSASWISQVERFFALLTEEQIRRGAHRSVRELEAAITAYIEARNADPRPFRWVRSADDILAAVERCCHRTIAVQDQCA